MRLLKIKLLRSLYCWWFTAKACDRLDEGINALAIFFDTRDEVEAMLLRQEKADTIIDQLIGLIRQTAEQNPLARQQAI